MAAPFGTCPQCSARMRIERLACIDCGVAVTGQIAIPLLATLPEEQARFVETFLGANGSLSRVQKEMGCSYPKVRRLMNDVMETLRSGIDAAIREKEQILKQLEDEQIDGREAAQRLRQLIDGMRGIGDD